MKDKPLEDRIYKVQSKGYPETYTDYMIETYGGAWWVFEPTHHELVQVKETGELRCRGNSDQALFRIFSSLILGVQYDYRK